MAAFIMAFNYFFGNIHDALKDVFHDGLITRYGFLLPLFLLIATGIFYIIKKRKSVFAATSYINILLILLIFIDAIQLAAQWYSRKINVSYKNAYSGLIQCPGCEKPDVYIIVLDEYAGDMELHDIFNYDNTPFFDSLAGRGFKTIAHSHSNYNYTPYSIASTLNMEYLDTIKTKNARKGYKHVINRIDNNRIINFFLANGYDFFNYSSFMIAGQPAPVKGSFIPVGSELITAGTFLTRFKKDVWPNLAEKLNLTVYIRKSTYRTLKDNEDIYELTKKVSEIKSKPKLVFTHLLMPHYPYYYSASGELRSFEALRQSKLDNTNDYLSYLRYTNKTILSVVDHIISSSANPPIIAILSDHGYRQYKYADAVYYFSNLLTIHSPGRNYDLYNDSMSNVNFFRILLNSEFRQSLPLLENKTFLIDF